MIFFDTIVKRVSNFSVQSFEDNKRDVLNFFDRNELFQLSILTSSRSLYDDIKKNKTEKTVVSLNKYFKRAHFNPTPFGVFNSVGVLNWGNDTLIPKAKKLKLIVKYDNLFLSSKINELMLNEWQNLNYCTNPSLHFLSKNKISFYKSKFQTNDIVEINHVEIDYDEDLEWLLNKFKNCSNIKPVIDELILSGFEREDVENYLLNTIETGLIIEEFLFNPYLKKLENQFNIYPSTLIKSKIHLLENIEEFEGFTETYINEQNVFLDENKNVKNSHSINSFDIESGTLDSNIKAKIKKFIDFTITYNSDNKPFNYKFKKFIDETSNKYNDGFISLNTLFNPYSGASYKSLKTDFEMKLHQDLVNKIVSATEKNIFLDVTINDDIQKKKSKLPSTFNVSMEVLICKSTGDKITYFKHLGGASALNIMSRFSESTNAICQEIVAYEKEKNKGKIIADINCIASFRSLNISTINQFYDYSIPINTSFTNSSNPIFSSDIYIHLRDGNLSLVSKKEKKQILPKKTSAVNPKLLDSDLYNFLCDLEFYNQEIYAVNFDFNSYTYFKPFVPKIYLEKDVLLSPAQILLSNNNYSFNEFKMYLLTKIEEYDFTKKINFADIKGNIILDTENEDDIKLLYEKLKTKKHFYISEFLYELFDPEIVRGSENFAHELIVNVKNTEYFRENIDYENIEIVPNENDHVPMLSEWLYLDLYCNSYADSEIFNAIYKNIILKNKCELFFFVHYNNPDNHLRLRFKTNSLANKKHIINKIQELKDAKIISKYQILPYVPETHRYGGNEMMNLSESIFDLDSRDFLLNVLNKDAEEDDIQLIAMLKLKNYLTFLGYTIDEMIVYCETCVLNFSQEFKLTSELRKEFNKKYASIKTEILEFQYNSFLEDSSFKEIFRKQFIESKLNIFSYTWLLIHMSMNRHFSENQRYNEFKTYYLTKCYLNQLKFTQKNNN